MDNSFIAVNTPLFGGKEKEYLNECIDTGWVSSEGPFVTKFESYLAEYCGRKHAIAVSNGTAALDIAVRAIGIRAGDEVIIPSFTIISCAQAVVAAGATPVVVDCDLMNWNMSVKDIEANITDKTVAIMAVHIYGLAVDMLEIKRLANKYNLKIIEDAAEAIGMTIHGTRAGGWGDISTFSFYPNKHITTGEGGMVLTDDDKTAEYCRELRNLCFKSGRRFVHDEIGWNYRLTNLQAAVGCAQFENLSHHLKKKKFIGNFYNERLQQLKNVNLPMPRLTYCDNLYWVYGLVIGKEDSKSAEYYMSKLQQMGIGTRPFFWPIHKQPVFLANGLYNNLQLKNSEYIAKNGFYIPSGLGLTNDELQRVADCVIEVFS